MAESIPVIMNPIAGGGRLLRAQAAVEAAARDCDATLEWWPTRGPGHGEELARSAARQARPLVLAYGGDGTYNEVARGLLGSASAIGVVPGGTTSVLAHEFDVPRPAERAVAALLNGEDRAMRVGRTDRGEVFLLMLSAGPDSLIGRVTPLRSQPAATSSGTGSAFRNFAAFSMRSTRNGPRCSCSMSATYR